MRIGTLTFHRAQNFGAMLQAHALQKVICQFGHDCEIIDYRCKKLENSYKNFMILSRGIKGIASAIIHFPNRYKRRGKFNLFSKKYYKLSSQSYTEESINMAVNEYDAIVVGSDQVWNPFITGEDKNYFLDFVESNTKKISYAASLGVSSFGNAMNKYLSKQFMRFDSISVREDSAQETIKKICGLKPAVVLDPVFLLDSTYWKSIAKAPIIDKYVFLYELHEKKTREIAKNIANKMGVELLLIPNDLRGGIEGKKVYAPLVEEFLGFILNAECVVTDSFHVAAFSIIFHKKLIVLMKSNYEGLNTRLYSLLNKLGMAKCIVEDNKEFNVSEVQIDYTQVEKTLSSLRVESIEYLKKSLV